ncbi:sn-glycerol-3-phosphate ABC transporter permease UgpA [Chelatococcus daeguensis]|uniref:sn-glycerol-3-phosphate transport system permease protein UgpA n=2 Tax=Chelatococcus TaxID=28209 RepID=A0AAC9NY25_9HYPH|nr:MULTISPECIES: sn-glycerol-3-phosphate ABC transporter permease UgpA [Chelatococcus]APF36126.1 glycerol-3-phosphate transporter permease [Chelatococcus daeguensis]KZE34765.1 glycerol-3-phosphate transporter permease [Chelatococcus daeguensis]MBM3082617.1 sn-glycerol-3-phosphate ABC transporter permease UgpA [Chelatococcus daeguensis]CUA88827.1 carbohydrate ABC transporter membrane protein 1, CUT1 family (TC 3.A.1.1.-) [Chelatococcus sambhunathii]
MQAKRVTFGGGIVPYLLLAPQLAITIIFFLWPAGQALYTSLFAEDAFGLSRQFVGLANFVALFEDPSYRSSFAITVVFSASVAAISLGLGLLFALAADKVGRKAMVYQTLLIWPYAVAPAVAAILWWFMFDPSVGVVARGLRAIGIYWNHHLNGTDALIMVILAASWKQVSYNFLFFLAGLQAIPRTLVEAAALDGAGPWLRFRKIVWPLLAPTTFFLLVVNIVYAFFDTFGIIHATTGGGPGQSTTILVYKVFKDGFESLNLGASAAQSVVLLVIVIGLTALQFRHIERKVHY